MSNDNSSRVSVNIIGGTTQVQHGATPLHIEGATTPQQQEPQIGKMYRSTPSGVESMEGVTRSTSVDPQAGSDGGGLPGILSTARNRMFGSITSDLSANTTILKYGGMEITPATAFSMGLITKDANGNYAELNLSSKEDSGEAQNEEDGQVSDGSEPTAFTPETEQQVVEFASHFHPAAQDRIIAQIIGGNSSLTQADIEAAGLDPVDANGRTSVAIAAFEGQAAKFVQSKGVDFEDFTSWAHESHPEAIRSAMRMHVLGRTPGAYADLVEKYLQSVPPSADALARAGIQTKETPEGTLVNLNGTWMTLKAATRMGLL